MDKSNNNELNIWQGIIGGKDFIKDCKADIQSNNNKNKQKRRYHSSKKIRIQK